MGSDKKLFSIGDCPVCADSGALLCLRSQFGSIVFFCPLCEVAWDVDPNGRVETIRSLHDFAPEGVTLPVREELRSAEIDAVEVSLGDWLDLLRPHFFGLKNLSPKEGDCVSTTRLNDERDAASAFAAQAAEFLSVVETNHSHPDRIGQVLQRLAFIVAAATNLPEVNPSRAESPRVSITKPEIMDFGEFEFYWFQFDSFTMEEPVAGSLAEDIAEVCEDLRRGLHFFDKGDWFGALWEWKFGYDTHWGRHAVNAIKALWDARNRVS